jgi:IclR family transcriptional regulator, acetate operon repressor
MRKIKDVTKILIGTRTIATDETEPSCYERIARILICLSTGMSSVTEIAKECNMKVPTVHRLLKSLTKPRFTVYDPINHRYFLGPLIAQVGSNASTNHQYLRMCSLTDMKNLSDNTSETVTLTVLIGNQFIQIKQIESKYELRIHELGINLSSNEQLFPLGATQKMLLSQLEDKDLKSLLNSMVGTQNLPGVDGVFEELVQIRAQGFASSSGERIPGAVCLSCPVTNYFFPTALSIIGPKSRISKKVSSLLQLLKDSAARISETLLTENILKNQ